MAKELKLPKEGLVTLGATFTLQALLKVSRGIQKLKTGGSTEKEILERLGRDLPDFSAAGRRRLYDIALGTTIPDDFTPDDVAEQKAVKKDTFEVRLKQPRAELVTGALIHYLGANWYVSRAEQGMLILRKLV